MCFYILYDNPLLFLFIKEFLLRENPFIYFIIVRDTFFDQLELCVDRICRSDGRFNSSDACNCVGHQLRLVRKKMSSLNLSASGMENRSRVNGIGLTWEKRAYLLEHLAVLVVTEIIRSKPPLGQCLGQIDRFFLLGLIETQNQEGLQRRPGVREVPLFASVVHGSWRATCDETSVSFSYVSASNAADCCALIRDNRIPGVWNR